MDRNKCFEHKFRNILLGINTKKGLEIEVEMKPTKVNTQDNSDSEKEWQSLPFSKLYSLICHTLLSTLLSLILL